MQCTDRLHQPVHAHSLLAFAMLFRGFYLCNAVTGGISLYMHTPCQPLLWSVLG